MTSYGFCQCGCGQRTTLADRTRPKLGWIKGQPHRFIVGHNNESKYLSVPYREVDCGYSTPCWIWQLRLTRDGYGQITVNGWDGSTHRYFYRQYVGEIPDGLELDHLCRVRSCICPSHLDPVTRLINQRRGLGTRLNEQIVAYIKSQLAVGQQTVNSLAAQFGVTISAIHQIKHGRNWGDVR